jgi:DNA (cytosine-5)-methyltransferase 1
MKILNLYACLGGNRYKWNEVNNDIKVTAVELDSELAKLYQERFPKDKVIVADAHEYLLKNYQNYDFIWSSPPCPTHSRARYWGFGANGKKPIYPDMKLYQEILLLHHYYKGVYCVENVIPFYKPLITAQKRGRHLYWCNFKLPYNLSKRSKKMKEEKTNSETLKHYNNYHDYDFTKYKGNQLILKIARNLVDYEAGKTIFQTAYNIYKSKKINQGVLNFNL